MNDAAFWPRILWGYLPRSLKTATKDVLPDRLVHRLNMWERDGMIVSFPKCGRTWLRAVIGEAIKFELGDIASDIDPLDYEKFLQLSQRIPVIRHSHDDDPMFKTPSELETDKSKYKRKRVVFLARDPRDVVVSWYFQVTERGSYSGFPSGEIFPDIDLDRFLRLHRGSLRTVIQYFNIWARQDDVPRERMKIARYEDLRNGQRTYDEFFSTLDHLAPGFFSHKSVRFAVDACQFAKMKSREKDGRYQHPALQGATADAPDSFKVRRGKVAGYKDYFNEADLEYAADQIASLDSIFSYSAS